MNTATHILVIVLKAKKPTVIQDFRYTSVPCIIGYTFGFQILILIKVLTHCDNPKNTLTHMKKNA